MNVLIVAAGLLFASAPSAADAPYFYCEVTRDVPFGNVTVLQYVSTAGESEPPVTTWFAQRPSNGTVILAAWHNAAELADGGQGGEIFFGHTASDRSMQYRMEIAPWGAADGARVVRSELLTPSANGIIGFEARWAPVMALLAAGADLEVRVLAAGGAVVHRDRVGADEFGRSLRIAREVQPEFEALIADYRGRCHPTNSNGR